MAPRILITGASIAGNMAALCLGRVGFDVTVVERAPDFRVMNLFKNSWTTGDGDLIGGR